jgi:CubicO group peptidase (beta-lactamase class C family)
MLMIFRSRMQVATVIASLGLNSCNAAAGERLSPIIPSSAASPLIAACNEFKELRDRELGQAMAASASPLDSDNARDLFRRAEAFGYSGGLQLTKDGHTLISEGYGMANRARGVPITSETIFDIGSVSKQFTGAAILRLEEMGRLGVDDPISRHLPAVPADKQAITIHHLLIHAAGFPHDVGDNQTHPSRDEAVRQMLAAELRSEPGTKHAYTNVGYALLAAIVESASGKSYERFLRDELWLPLGMTRTGMVLGGLDRAEVAEGYMFDGPLPPNRYRTPDRDGASWLVRGAGYILSTLNDMERWGEALRTGQILSDASRRKLFQPHIRENDKTPSYYGYGWALFSNRDGSCRIAHDGSAGVHYAFLSFFPERDVVLTSYTTQQRAPWRYFPRRVYSALAGDELELPAVAEAAPGGVEWLAGDYRLPSGAVLPVRMQEGRPYIEILNADALRLFSPWPILGPERTASLGDRQKLVSTVMDGIARRDYRPLFQRLRKGVDHDEERRFWEENWPRWTRDFGEYLGTELAGTVELGSADSIRVEPEDRLRSLALARFSRGSVLLGFVHGPEGTTYVDWMPQHMMRDILIAPQEAGSFLSYSPNTKRHARLVFQRNQAGSSLLIENGQETAQAIRR